jgi:hypothetical protein
MNDAKDLIQDILGQTRGRSGVPGLPNGIPIVLILVAALIAWGALTSFYTVQPEERAVVKRFGEVVGITDPGLHFKLPFGVDEVQLVATERVLKQEFGFRSEEVSAQQRTQFANRDFPGESLMLTGDLNIIQVEWVVQYRIGDPVKYLYNMREPLRTLRDRRNREHRTRRDSVRDGSVRQRYLGHHGRAAGRRAAGTGPACIQRGQ